MPDAAMSRPRHWALVVAVVLTLPIWGAFVVLVTALRGLAVLSTYLGVWLFWIGSARRRALFVYSDCPHWKDHVEARILPRLPSQTVVLNWSRRAEWPRLSFEVLLFRMFAGDREFNPIGLVLERFNAVESYRFWQPFRDAKHGRTEGLAELEARFLEHVTG